jgi:hypothetical protein
VVSRDQAKLWRDAKARLGRDRSFLEKWLSALEELPRFAARKNYAIIAMLKKRLAVLA